MIFWPMTIISSIVDKVDLRPPGKAAHPPEGFSRPVAGMAFGRHPPADWRHNKFKNKVILTTKYSFVPIHLDEYKYQ
jgi:hypothetical protein